LQAEETIERRQTRSGVELD
jgi:hypothetical protein